ncbi:hypothetical protein KAM484_30070 [Aeromonas caviae]|nr:hypothetical protein KAM467_33240 [Aeromonas caviae]GKR52968.1 hypothetical protein KAM475_21150 [Aeromonas caviae]GKR92202.1 hypothetical protein KAM484_30070 [Aeromonas caviae]
MSGSTSWQWPRKGLLDTGGCGTHPPRAKAVQKLEEFLERVEEWNACEPYVWVQYVWLYGSLITTAPDVVG